MGFGARLTIYSFRVERIDDLVGACVDKNRLVFDFDRRHRFAEIHAGVRGMLVFGGHLPKRILDDAGRVAADAEFQKERSHAFVSMKEIAVSIGGGVPAFVFDEGAIGAKVHCCVRSTMGAIGHKLAWYTHVVLLIHHG